MTTEGPNSPSTGANDAAFGSTAWLSPGNILSSDNSRATASLTAGSDSNYLKATGFGFSIPGGATIDGIVVEIEKNANAASAIQDARVRIVKADGSIGSTDKAAAGTWATADAYTTYGGAADLWGETWSAADINDADFGVVIACTNVDVSTRTGRVDHVRITVHYTESGGVVVAPAAASAVGVVIAPVVELGSVAVGPAAVTAVVETISPNTILGSISIAPAPAVAVVDVVPPTVVLGSVVVAPGAVTAVAGVVDPAVLTGGLVVSPSPVTAVAEVVAPGVVLGSIVVLPSPVTAVVSTVTPTVVMGSTVATPLPATAVAAVAEPTVIAGSPVVLVEAEIEGPGATGMILGPGLLAEVEGPGLLASIQGA